ncbi:MAG: hypothetical protein DYH05_07475 [Acidobacteria bacterium ACB1]|nr:hypothetical protein [Pyrinomonadaceae bacterium]MCE7962325.1 hypothetical protein [Acidobacteria bacterium ACB1]RIJ88776.1 MAG: hypothetical protein DCC44_12765 [Acidobacteriota bacterium]
MDAATKAFTDAAIAEIYSRCSENAPNYGVSIEAFSTSVFRTIEKRLESASSEPLTEGEIREFLDNLQADDLFLALACAAGNERAWWEFDQTHRSYMERFARHLARGDADPDEVIGNVYIELYGTRVVDGERYSKFGTYSGRGSLRGWLRTIIWHSVVDQHRAGHSEVSLDEMTETIGEGAAHASFAMPTADGDSQMIEQVAREKYRAATVAALSEAFSALEPHEKLLIALYHVDNLKLREISRLVENESSPLRGWIKRRSSTREKDPSARIHESTVMRWLEKSYERILDIFKRDLAGRQGLNPSEVEICIGLASADLAGPDIYRDLAAG